MPSRYDTETLGFLIADVARLLRAEFDRRTSGAGMGLTPGAARTLSALARAGSIRQTALAERMGIEAMTLSAFLDRLEARGLIVRETDPTDRRAKLVSITDAAHAVMEQVARVGEGIRADMAGDLTADQMDQLRQMLRHIRTNLAAMRPDCTRGSSTA